MIERHAERDRGVSITITHVLTIAITTVLIAMLLTSASALLESETKNSADSSLETIGERLADEIGNVDRIASTTNKNVTVTTEHPRTVARSRYTITLLAAASCGSQAPLLDGSTDCLKLTAQGVDAVVYVPVKINEAIVSGSTATGGTIEIRYDGSESEISLRSVNR